MENKGQPTKIQRWVAGILTIAFIPMLFVFGAHGLLSDTEVIKKSFRYSYAQHFLASPDDATKFFPMLSARLSSFENQIGKHIPFYDELGYLNAGLQHAIGKDLVVQGSQQLLRMPNGQIYNVTATESLAEQANEVVGLYNDIGGEIPFLFSYLRPQFFEGVNELPEGYDALDNGDELADEMLSIVRAAGIDALDSREFFIDSGYTDNELNIKTDKHWTTLAALLATEIYAEEINRLTGANLDVSRIRLDQFETELHENLFLGEYGQQIGEVNSGLDDIILYWPKYETHLSRHTIDRDDTVEDAEGDFREAVIRMDAFDNEPDGTNIRGYIAYGLTERIEEITNHGECEDLTVLMFRDSYSAPIGCFLSLMVKEVVMVDMRTEERSALELVEHYDPDIVIFSQCQQMYEDYNYSLTNTAGE